MPHAATDMPPWITDDAQVARRILARQDDAPVAELWWDVAACARLIERLTAAPPPVRERCLLLADALHLLAAIGRRLPPPLPSAGDEASWFGTLTHRRFGPGTAALDRITAALCADLDEPWSCPHRLSGLIEDLTVALTVYAQEYARLLPVPSPRRVRSWTCRRPALPSTRPRHKRPPRLTPNRHLPTRGTR